ncbi:MAG: L-threonylcarbamoyladenylate synthase [Clostridia bacterium]|nr:L-threonylcarbamoyladenylate synthase [Clostridia bacterium]
MKTLFLTEKEIDTAAEIIKKGGLVAMPTETVYGLAADATNGSAVKKIYSAKGRPSDNPLIVHVSSVEEIYPLVTSFPENAKKLIETFCPGPLTIVFPKSDVIPPEISGGLDTVAIRFPSHPIARKLIKASGVPLAAPSANLSGSPSPTSADHVKKDLDGRIDAILDGGECSVGLESTVITLVPEKPVLLRPGGITHEMLESVLGEVLVDPAVLNPLKEGQKVSSPGMKYKHYAPKAKVVLIKSDDDNYYKYLADHRTENMVALCYNEDLKHIKDIHCISYGKKDDYAEQASMLFDALRKIDEQGYELVYGRCPGTDGVGLAVYNRLIRAAGFEVIEIE